VSSILLLGSTGLLGAQIHLYLKERGHSVYSVSRNGPSDLQVDVGDRAKLAEKLAAKQFDVVLNLIALTSVDICESNPNEAFVSNVRTVENIVNWISEYSPTAHLIQISTDHVYNGLGPHEEDEVTIVNTYAMTKFAGELAAKIIPATILRTNFIGKSMKSGVNGLSDWLFTSLINGKKVEVLTDVFFSPVSIKTLCSTISKVVELRPVGIFNLGSRSGMSKAEFSYEFARRLNLDLRQITDIDSLRANFHVVTRPKDMRMDSSKLEEVLELSFPSFIDEIRKVADEYK
jgi:dTDP-4-dehydrorhamnose reductase